MDSIHTDVRNKIFRTSEGFQFTKFHARLMQVKGRQWIKNYLKGSYRENWVKVYWAGFSVAAKIHTGSQEKKAEVQYRIQNSLPFLPS